MKILLHQCCGPCSIYPIHILLENNFEITTYFYNPNIHPMHEFYKRLNGAIDVSQYYNLKSLISKEYGLTAFLNTDFLYSSKRCSFCYDIRIKKVAKYAAENGYDYFSSSLLYSKYQNHEEIINICEKYSKEYGVGFYYYDFREGWKTGIEKSKSLKIYRQQYCGCIFSEIDRYDKQLSKQLIKRIESDNSVEVV